MKNGDLNFDQLVLSKSELRQLRKAFKKGRVPSEKCRALISMGLMTEEKLLNAGYAPIPTGFAEITQSGVQYLQYIKRRTYEYRTTRWISVIALVISILALLLQALTQLRPQ